MTIRTLTALAIAAAAALPLAAPVHAESAGAVQLARSVGVEPGVYSLSQLAQIAALRAEDTSQARFRIAQIVADPRGPGAFGAVALTTRSADGSVGGYPATFFTSEPNRLAD